VHSWKSKRAEPKDRRAVDGGIAEPRVNDDPAEGKKREAWISPRTMIAAPES
jgi:hypothetical protein